MGFGNSVYDNKQDSPFSLSSGCSYITSVHYAYLLRGDQAKLHHLIKCQCCTSLLAKVYSTTTPTSTWC